MKEYFQFLDLNWRSILSNSASDISKQEAQELIYKTFLERKSKDLSEFKPKKVKAGGKTVGSFCLKNSFLDEMQDATKMIEEASDLIEVEDEIKSSRAIVEKDIEGKDKEKDSEVIVDNARKLVCGKKRDEKALTKVNDEVKEVKGSQLGLLRARKENMYQKNIVSKEREQFKAPRKPTKVSGFNPVSFPLCTELMNTSVHVDVQTTMNQLETMPTTCQETVPQCETKSDHGQENRTPPNPGSVFCDTQIYAESVPDLGPEFNDLVQAGQAVPDLGAEIKGSVPAGQAVFQKTCDQCNKTFKQLKSFKTHICRKNYVKIACPSCSKMVSKSNMSHHLKLHSALKFNCGVCKKIFRSTKVLEEHLKDHKLSKHVCDICGRTCERPSHLKKHKETHVSKHTGSQCKFCDFESISMSKLKSHLFQEHAGLAVKCGQCKKPFFSKRGLRAHLKIHGTPVTNSDGDKPDTAEKNEGLDNIAVDGAAGSSVIVNLGNDDSVLSNAVVYDFSIIRSNSKEEVIADGISTIGELSITTTDMLPFIANL